jgi:RND family efflux transporter MFP subunit
MDFNKIAASTFRQLQRAQKFMAQEFRKKNSARVGALALAGIAVISVVISLAGCNVTPEEDLATAQEVYVQVENVAAKSLDDLAELSGTLEPIEEATVSFEVSGMVKAVNVQEGSRVKAGDILASIDSANYNLQVQQAHSQSLNAETAYNQAATDFKRYETLYNAGALAQSDYEKAKMNMEAAQNNLNSAHAAQQQVELALSKTALKSPLTGVVLSKYLAPGQLTAAGTPAYKIGNTDQLKVSLMVADYAISSWKIGDKTSLKLYEEAAEGEVTKIFPAANEQTGGITAEVTVNNAEHKWHAGQVVTCSHNAESLTAIYVPKEAVISHGGSAPYVFLVINEQAVKTEVTIGTLRNNLFEIKSGLQENDQLIVKGADRLSDGDQVTVIGSDEQ